MSATIKSRLRKLLVLLASIVGLLAWAAAAAAAAGNPADPSPRPDTGEPQGNKPVPLNEASALLLPDKWANSSDLLQAAAELNSRLAQAERGGKLVPWDLADQIHRSMAAGKALAAKLEADGPIPYYQVLFMSALAAGYPDDAMLAARELTKLDGQEPRFWLPVYRAGMVQGDKAACLEAIGKLRAILKKEEGLEPMKNEADPIGPVSSCELQLSDNTTLNPAKCPGKVLVVNFWMHTEQGSKEATPYMVYTWQAFCDYADFRMVGVNMDSRQFKPGALGYMKANGMDWPSHFEGQTDRPISGKAFRIHQLPAEVVVGPDGKVIFCGVPNNPVFCYAIRAALVKANKGAIPASQPDGRAAGIKAAKPTTPIRPVVTPPGTVDPASPATPAALDPAAVAKEKARQEKAAAEQLKIADAFLAAGAREQAIEVYKEIVKRYPDSNAAVKANVELIALGP